MIQYAAVATVIFILMLYTMLMHVLNEGPHVFRFGRHGPTITIIGGIHGNEPAPALYLEELVDHLRRNPPSQFQLVIVPRANPEALDIGLRSVGRDLNRAWDDKETRSLRKLVDQSDLVVDMHEAWSFEKIHRGSLGQTVYTNSPALVPAVDQMIARLNRLIADPAHQFQRLDILPVLTDGTSLDMYCVNVGKPYILLEFAGQRDIVALASRRQQCLEALDSLFGIRPA